MTSRVSGQRWIVPVQWLTSAHFAPLTQTRKSAPSKQSGDDSPGKAAVLPGRSSRQERAGGTVPAQPAPGHRLLARGSGWPADRRCIWSSLSTARRPRVRANRLSPCLPLSTPACPGIPKSTPSAIRSARHLACAETRPPSLPAGFSKPVSGRGLEPELLASLVLTESSFRKDVVSHVGAIGPAQVRPEYWSGFCGSNDLLDPAENIYCGAQVLSHLMDRCGDDTDLRVDGLQHRPVRRRGAGRPPLRLQGGSLPGNAPQVPALTCVHCRVQPVAGGRTRFSITTSLLYDPSRGGLIIMTDFGVLMFPDGLRDSADPARAGGGGARLRVSVFPRAHPYSGEPEEPLAGRCRPASRSIGTLTIRS